MAATSHGSPSAFAALPPVAVATGAPAGGAPPRPCPCGRAASSP